MFSKPLARLVVPFAFLTLAALATTTAAAASETFNWSVQSSTAPVASCVGGGALPCSNGTVRVTYPSTQLGTDSPPFSNYPFFRQPATLTGYLDVPTSNLDPSTGCYSGVTGTFQVLVARGGGNKQRLAFELDMNTSAYCSVGTSDVHFTSGTFAINGDNSEDPTFRRGVTGAGTFVLQDSVDFTGVNSSGFLDADFQGSIDVA